MKETIIIIPPSEGKLQGADLPKLSTTVEPTKSLIKEILSQKENLEKFYGLKEKALNKAIQTNKAILTSKTLPSIERYNGVVYKAMDVPTIKNKKDLQLIHIFSPLFGLIRSDTPIPDYKFKIDKLNATKLWHPTIKEQLKNKYVIDLLPKAYDKAVEYQDGIKIEFILIKQGKKMPAGHQGKHIKGRFIRWMIDTKTFNSKDFHKFKEDGYKWQRTHFEKKI